MLYNELLRNTTLSTDYGIKNVDSKGVIEGLTDEQEKEIGKLKGFEYTQSKQQEKPKETPKQESKQENKKETTQSKATQSKKKTTSKTTSTKTKENQSKK